MKIKVFGLNKRGCEMKKILTITLLFAMVATFVWAAGDREKTPKVRYVNPRSESIVDLTGEENLTFKWKSTPIPGGGRIAYKFEVYKDFGYEKIVNEVLGERNFSIEIPSEKFENNQLYTWQVKQRDRRTRIWSMDSRWSFTAKK